LRSRSALLALALLLCLPLAACGGDESGDGESTAPPEPNVKDFPAANGKTLADILRDLGQGGPVLAPSVSQLTVGQGRLGFGLFDPRTNKQISDAPTVVYVAPVGGGEALGPFKARYESLEVKPQFASQTVASDPDSAKTVYVADARFPTPGKYEVLGVTRLDDRLVAATPAGPPLAVLEPGKDPVPNVGDPAPRFDTPTKEDVGGDLSQIDTRTPPSTMHDVSFADVAGEKPVVLVFATPLLCASRVCGPVVDIAEEVKAERGDEAEFIHQEIYKNNSVDQGFRPQVIQWGLPSEPWVFTIDAEGNVAARLEGAFSARELNEAIDAAVGG
jgi:hypothetical protein